MMQLLNNVRFATEGKGPKGLDLFSGAGGLSIGFAMAGGFPLGAVDFDPDSIETFSKTFPLAQEVVCGPIEDWRPKTAKKNVDIIMGG